MRWITNKKNRTFNKLWIQNAVINAVNDQWIWDTHKNTVNKQKHNISFETAILVFNDPQSRSRRDQYPREERWQTIGFIHGALVLVVHTAPKLNVETGKETGRIITARKATKSERRAYEEGDF